MYNVLSFEDTIPLYCKLHFTTNEEYKKKINSLYKWKHTITNELARN